MELPSTSGGKHNKNKITTLFIDSRRLSPAFFDPQDSINSKKKGFLSPRGKSTSPRPGLPPPNERSYSCFDCFQNFNSLFELIEHKVDQHKTGRESGTVNKKANNSYNLSGQERTLEDLQDLKIMRPPDPPARKTYICLYCSYTSGKKKEIAQHITNEHPGKPHKPTIFECNICKKSFPKRGNLRKHVMVHK